MEITRTDDIISDKIIIKVAIDKSEMVNADTQQQIENKVIDMIVKELFGHLPNSRRR